MYVKCLVSGPDVEDCSKNGKKAAEAMSLSKEGKSAHHYLQDKVKAVAVKGYLIIFVWKYIYFVPPKLNLHETLKTVDINKNQLKSTHLVNFKILP